MAPGSPGRPVFEEEIGGFIYREREGYKEPRMLLLGLPEVGLAGSIAGAHLVRSLGLKFTLGIDSYSLLPPALTILKGAPVEPVRIYTGDQGLGVLLTDIPIPPQSVVGFSASIVEFARSRGVEYVVGLSGYGNPRRVEMEKPSLYWLASDDESTRLAGSIEGGRAAEEGIIVGPYAVIMKESVRKRIHNILLLADSFIDIPDPEAAATLVSAVSSISGVEVGVDKLLEEAELIKIRLRELMKETRSVMGRMGKGYEYRAPLMYT